MVFHDAHPSLLLARIAARSTLLWCSANPSGRAQISCGAPGVQRLCSRWAVTSATRHLVIKVRARHCALALAELRGRVCGTQEEWFFQLRTPVPRFGLVELLVPPVRSPKPRRTAGRDDAWRDAQGMVSAPAKSGLPSTAGRSSPSKSKGGSPSSQTAISANWVWPAAVRW